MRRLLALVAVSLLASCAPTDVPEPRGADVAPPSSTSSAGDRAQITPEPPPARALAGSRSASFPLPVAAMLNGRLYESARTLPMPFAIALCPRKTIKYITAGKQRVGTYALKGSVIVARFDKRTEQYAVSADLKHLVFSTGLMTYRGSADCESERGR